jgi:hypothetical protein
MTSQSDYITAKQAFRVIDSYNMFNNCPYATEVQLINTSNVLTLYMSTFVSPVQLASTTSTLVAGISSLVAVDQLASTVIGLAIGDYFSTSGIASSFASLGTYGYVSTLSLTSSLQGLGTMGYLSSFNSTVTGLGSTGYLSSLSLQSTITGLGSSKYVSSLSLTSTTVGLGTIGYLSSYSNTVFQEGLTSSIIGLGSLGYLSSFDVIPSTIVGLASVGYVSSLSLTSSLQGLASVGYLSSLSLTSTVAGLGTLGYLSSYSTTVFQDGLTSSLQGLGSLSYVSSLDSTVKGLGTIGYLSSYGSAVFQDGLTSSLQGLGTLGYLSSYGSAVFQDDLTSSIKGLGTLGYISTYSASGISSLSTTVSYGISTLSTTIGLQISSILSSFTTFPRLGNTLTVDQVNGNDATASPSGLPYKTVNAALSAVLAGDSIWVLPGTYNLSAGLVLPNNISIRGMSVQTTIIQMLNVTGNTTLITMGENTRIEDLTLKLTSQGHYALTGMEIGGTTTVTGKIRTCVLTVDNSNASFDGTSDVNAVLASGTGTLDTASFSFNSLKGCTFNVYSNGAGRKRGILVTGPNVMSTRDVNVYVAKPRDETSTGSYVGVETDNTDNLGSIQLRATTVGTVSTLVGGAYTSSDIKQTTPATIIDPTYLASAGIQIGPGVDLITKTAGGKGFSVYNYPTTIYYGLKGDIKSGTSGGYLWPGTQKVSPDFPDTGAVPAYYRVQQPCLISGLSVGANIAAGTGNTTTILVKYTPVGGTPINTPFTVTMNATDLYKNFYNGSVKLNTGDKIHVQLSYTGGGGPNANNTHDLTVQIDTF